MYFLPSRVDSKSKQDLVASPEASSSERAHAGRSAPSKAPRGARALRSLGAISALGLAAFSLTALSPLPAEAAGEKDKDAMKLHDQAMDEDYLSVEFAKAEKKLKDALKKCGADGCTPKVLGKLHVAMGTVHGANGKMDLAKESFIAALKADPTAALNESLTTPDLAKAFKEAQKAAGVTGKPAGEKPAGEKPTGEKPTGETPTGEKPTGEKPTGEKPEGPKKPAGDLNHTPPVEQAVNTPVPIYIEIPEEVDAQKVTLRYKPFGGTKWKTLEMQRVRKGYGVEIPCEDVTTTGDIKYFIIAKDEAGDPAAQAGTMKEPHRVPIKNEIEGDPPSLPGKKPPEECAAKEDCPPGLPGCPGGPDATDAGARGDKGWGSSCDATRECKAGLICLNGTCEEGSGGAEPPEEKSKKKRNMVTLRGQLDVLFISGGDSVCSGTDASFVCFYQDSDKQFYGLPEDKDGTNGIQGGLGVAGGRVMVSYERQLMEKYGLTVGLHAGFAFGGSPSSVDDPYRLSDEVYPRDKGEPPSPHAKANPFLPAHVELRASYYFGNSMLEPKKVRPYVFLGGGLAQVNAAVPVTVCDTAYDTGNNRGNAVAAADVQGDCEAGEIRRLNAYQITGLNFIEVGGGATFGLTPNFGLSAELKLMFMVPTFGFVVAPSLGPVFAF